MGKQKYQHDLERFLARNPVVSYASIARIVRHKKKVKQYVKQLIRQLIAKGKLKPLVKGYYTTQNDASLAVFCFQPAYLGLQDALSHHNLWEQETIPIIITTRAVRTGIRNVLGSNVLLRHLDKKYYLGIEYHATKAIALPYSDVEKTCIDMVHFKQKMSPEVKQEFKKRVNLPKLEIYLKPYPAKTKKTVLDMVGAKRAALIKNTFKK